MLTLNNISYTYRNGAEAVSQATANINSGINLLLGANGAGKTTLLHMLDGLLTPQQGCINFDGLDPSARTPEVLGRIFFLPDDFNTPFKNSAVLAECHGAFYPNFSCEIFAENLADFGLTAAMPFKEMSLGMKRKAYIAYALSLGVDLLLLDEPANGIDIDSKKTLRRMMSRCIAPEQTVILSTHTVWDFEALYDGVIILKNGHVIFSMSTSEIVEKYKFVTSARPLPEAIYQEPDSGLFRAILVNEDGSETAVNFALLYSAIVNGK